MTVLHIQAFGKLQMQYDGIMITSFPTRHAEELLAFLLLNQQAVHSREKLIDLLWPASDSKKARACLSTALWHLRRQFTAMGLSPDSYLQTSRDWVTLATKQPLHFDVAGFEQCVANAQLVDDEQREPYLVTAVHLYTGELCAGIYSDWCLIERERLARLKLRAAGELMSAYIRRRAYQKAVNLGQAILQEDPLREETHRALMFCYWQMGRRARAVRQFHHCAAKLMQELNIVPLPETMSLYHRIVKNRLQKKRHLTELAKPTDANLQAAFVDFLEAGNKLNALLDQVG